MEAVITGPLAAALARNRERFNRLYARAAQRSSLLDPGELASLVRGPLLECVNAVSAVEPEKAEAAAVRMFEICLVLYTHGHLGAKSRNPLVAAVWERLLPQVPVLLARSPRRLTASLSNAAVNIWQEDQAIARHWLKRLHNLIPHCESPEQALDAALVVAWRSGLAHYRETALQHWQRLPDHLKLASLGIGDEDGVDATVAATSLQQRWLPPHLAGKRTEPRLRIVGRVGSFKGIGGQFAEPPLVAGNGDMLIAYDAENSHTVWADFYGATLRRTQVAPEGFIAGTGTFSINTSGTVTFGSLKAQFPPLAGSSSCAATADTLAVTLPHSHAVYLVAPLATEPGK
ncbi:MAG: hypothetical protein WCP10_02335 [Desulfuromonadales bacterium]